MSDRKRPLGDDLVAVLRDVRKPTLVLFIGIDRGRIDVAGHEVLRPRLADRFRRRLFRRQWVGPGRGGILPGGFCLIGGFARHSPCDLERSPDLSVAAPACQRGLRAVLSQKSSTAEGSRRGGEDAGNALLRLTSSESQALTTL